MKIISLDDFFQQQDFFIAKAKAGKLFVYPTDTVYGIGAIYTSENVEKIVKIKQSKEKQQPSIIVPSFEWIQKKFPQANNELMKKQLEDYHGVTYIFDYNRPGMRIIKHPIQEFVTNLGEGFISTSCNISMKSPITTIQDIPEDIASKIDYIIDGGILGGKPSVLIDFVSNKVIHR